MRNHTWAHRARTSGKIVLLASIGHSFAQSPPVSADRPWHWPEERQVISDAQRLHSPTLSIEPDKVYSLAELFDLAKRTILKHESSGRARVPKLQRSGSLVATYFQRSQPLR
jgi:hypothetical protein